MYATSNPILSIDVHYAFFQPLFNRRQPGSDSLGDVMGLATIRPIAEVSRELAAPQCPPTPPHHGPRARVAL